MKRLTNIPAMDEDEFFAPITAAVPQEPAPKKNKSFMTKHPIVIGAVAVSLFAAPMGAFAVTNLMSNAAEVPAGASASMVADYADMDSGMSESTTNINEPATVFTDVDDEFTSGGTATGVTDNIADPSAAAAATEEAAPAETTPVEETVVEEATTTEEAAPETASTPAVQERQTVTTYTTPSPTTTTTTQKAAPETPQPQTVTTYTTTIGGKSYTSTTPPTKTHPQTTAHKMNAEEMAEAQEIFNAYNDFRASKGLNRVAWSDTCANMAYAGSTGCAAQGALIHRLGIPGDSQHCYSDVLQYGSWKMTGEEAVTNWANSPGHRVQMQCPTATEAGVGVYKSGGTWFFTIVYDFSGTNIGGN